MSGRVGIRQRQNGNGPTLRSGRSGRWSIGGLLGLGRVVLCELTLCLEAADNELGCLGQRLERTAIDQ